MKNKWNLPVMLLCFTLLLGTTKFCSAQEGTYIGIVETMRLADVRAKVMRGDRNVLPDILDAFKKRETVYHLFALRMLATLGDSATLPTIEAYLNDKDTQNNNYMRDRARIVQARIIAENAAPQNTSPRRRAEAILGRFYKELGTSSESINSAVAKVPDANYRDANPDYNPPIEEAILWEVADMIYRGDSAAFLSLPDVRHLDFTHYDATQLKIELAPLSRTQRIRRLVDNLASKKILTGKETYDKQLLIDEGLPAAKIAAAKIREMGQNRSKHPANGFVALFQVLGGVGDKQQSEVMASFRQDSDPSVKNSAETPVGKRIYLVDY